VKTEPYEVSLVKINPFKVKGPIIGRVVAVLDLILENRGMKLIHPRSRALVKSSIFELAVTDEAESSPGKVVNRVGYIGFIEVTQGGVAVVGDNVYIGNRLLGEIVGFNEDHVPNHITVLVRSKELTTGFKFGVEVNDEVQIVM